MMLMDRGFAGCWLAVKGTPEPFVCMDLNGAEQNTMTPLQPEPDRVDHGTL
ncbi:hypothetical protein AB4Y96_15925 [Phyllobacterium sp. TAF24]|uniref:hypothetical protein n=1 Tax=Phyllobacterium sp. TAF24 TaxID=3233068 RepID=UPI003F9AA5C6